MKIGLMVLLANDREHNSTRPYETIRAIAQQAETDGFDSIWLADHLLYRDPGEPTWGIWECWTMLAALAPAIFLGLGGRSVSGCGPAARPQYTGPALSRPRACLPVPPRVAYQRLPNG